MARFVERFFTGVMLIIDLIRADDDSFWDSDSGYTLVYVSFITHDADDYMRCHDDESSLILAQLQINDSQLCNN